MESPADGPYIREHVLRVKILSRKYHPNLRVCNDRNVKAACAGASRYAGVKLNRHWAVTFLSVV